MRIKRQDLKSAVDAGLLQEAQVEPLWEFLGNRSPLRLRTVAYYSGALLIIAALSVFLVTGWERIGGLGILAFALAAIAALVLASEALAKRDGLAVPRGLLMAAAVCAVPLAIYGFQAALGWWGGDAPGTYRSFHEWVRSGWIWMELGTLAAGGLAVRRVRFPFLMFPIAFVLWYLSMDLTPVLSGDAYSSAARSYVSVAFGAAMLLTAYGIDWRAKEDFAFWLYLFGLLAFWGGLTSMDSGSELGRAVYALINLTLLAAGVVLQRRVFMVFSAIGLTAYLGHLAFTVFKDALLFTLVLAGVGFAILVAAIQAQRHAARIEALRQRWIPAAVARWVPPRR